MMNKITLAWSIGTGIAAAACVGVIGALIGYTAFKTVAAGVVVFGAVVGISYLIRS